MSVDPDSGPDADADAGRDTEYDPPHEHGRHELPVNAPGRAIGELQPAGVAGVVRRGRSQIAFAALAVVLCLLLGMAIATQARQTDSGDSLDNARPADLLVLLDSLQQREAALNTEVADLQRTLDALQASGSDDQAAIENARARLAALSILVGSIAATGPGVVLTIEDTAAGVSPETMLDVVNELRAAGAETMQIGSIRVGLDTWVVGAPGALVVDGTSVSSPYSVLAIGDPATLAAAMNIPGGAMDSVERVGGTMSVKQADVVDVTALRQPKPRQYAQPVK